MNQLQIFKHEQFGDVRTVILNGEIWFVAADVCRALEHSNVTSALERLDDDERSKLNLGRQGETNIVNEPGLYALILGSRKPEARAFKRWITHEVLPQIRRTGAYFTGEPADCSRIADMRAALDGIISDARRLRAYLPDSEAARQRISATRAANRPLMPWMFSGRNALLLDHEKFAELINAYLAENDQTVDALADVLGVDRRSVYRWKGAYAVPKPPVLREVVELRGCTLEDLTL